MQIRRDYSQPFFGGRRRRRGLWRLLIVYTVFLGGIILFVMSQFNSLQHMALEMVGQAPPPTPFASDLANEGYQKFLAGDVQAAKELFRRAVEQQPQNIDYLYEYGRMLVELGPDDPTLYTDAIEMGQRATQVNPRDPRGYALQALAMDLSGDSEGAIPVGQAGLQVDDQFAPLYYALAGAYTGIGRYEQGLEFAQNAVELDPMDAYGHRAYAYALIWNGYREDAVDQLEQAISLQPNLLTPYFELALQFRGGNQYAEAVATYERILTMRPNNAKANLRLCQVYVQIGQDRRAQGYCEDSLSAQPDYPEAMSMLGWVMYKRRNYEGAIEMFEQCQSLADSNNINEDTIRCWYMRGLAHYYLGDCEESWNILNESLPLTDQLASYARDTIGTQIRNGLSGVTANCTGYLGRALPTEIPPTPIPPTPIGG